MRNSDLERSRTFSVAVFVVLAGYLLTVRLWGVSESFLMLRDQIRDWEFALGPFRSLPLTGTQSTAGGSSFGPIYYWLLWIIRHLVGPFTANQPHAGAIGLSMFQTMADLALLYAIRRRFDSLWLALAIVLLAATSAHDLAIASTIWNPAVSVAFVKLALAAVLIEPERPTAVRVGITTVAIWFAVQAHTAALFIAAPILGTYVLREVAGRQLNAAFQRARAILEVILVLQLPFLYFMLTSSAEAAPVRALGGAANGLRWRASTEAMLRACASIIAAPHATSTVVTVLMVVIAAAAAVAAVRYIRDLRMLSITVLPLIATAVGFSLWQGGYDEYWYLPIAPCVALMLVLSLTMVQRTTVALVLVAVAVALQPGRIRMSRTIYRMPEYGALAKGSRTLYRQSPVIHRIGTSFPMPPLSNPGFVFEAMGGRFDDGAQFDAIIDEKGGVQFRRVPR